MFREAQTSEQDEGKFNTTEVENSPYQLNTSILGSSVVLRNLECEYGLLDQLLMSGCLTEDMIEQINSCSSYHRNKKLITYINQSNLKKFLTGLRSVHQEHISTYIVKNGERGSECDDWPIDDIMLKAINTMQDKFVREISKEWHDNLFSQGCLSELHRRSIYIKSTKEEMNMELLAIITRRSDCHLKKFLTCLENYNWDLISELESNLTRIKDSLKSFHIMGLTVCNNELFVVRDAQSKVNVYNSHFLTASRDINIPDMESPHDLAGCAHNKALYISDLKLMCIHRVDLTNNSVTRWTMRDNYDPLGLSVTAVHNLLVTVRISGTEGESRVVEYTSEGQQVHEIRIDRSMRNVWQTVQLSSNQFIVCHGYSYNMPNRVCQINVEGQIIKSYGGEKGEGKDQLNDPRSLTIDNNSKHVNLFVADTWNDRIVVYDSNLTYLGQIHTPRDLKHPRRLHFDSSTAKLFVGEYLNDRVIVIIPKIVKNSQNCKNILV